MRNIHTSAVAGLLLTSLIPISNLVMADGDYYKELKASKAAAEKALLEAQVELLVQEKLIEAYERGLNDASRQQSASSTAKPKPEDGQIEETPVAANTLAADSPKPQGTTEKTEGKATPKKDDVAKAEEEQAKGASKDKENWGPLYSKNPYFATFHIGSTLTSEYDDDGNNDGFTESNIFGRFNLDNRLNLGPEGDPTSYLHTGVNVDFFSGHVADCTKIDPKDSGDESNSEPSDDQQVQQQSQEACDEKDLDLSDVDFNDISNTVHASLYAWWQWKPEFDLLGNAQWEWGPGIRATIQSRDKLGENGDSINEIYSLGWRVMYHDFQAESSSDAKFANGLPIFFLETSYADYENFAGVEDANRWLISGAYRVFPQSPVYIGMVVNAGEGPDEIALTLSYGIDVSKVQNLF